MASSRTGFIDSYLQSRLNHLRNTTYPAAIAATYLALFSVLPASDGTGGTEVTGTRTAITLGVPTLGNSGYYSTNASSVAQTLANTSNSQVVGFGIFDAATGGNLIYTGTLYPFSVAPLASVTIPASAVKVFSDLAFA